MFAGTPQSSSQQHQASSSRSSYPSLRIPRSKHHDWNAPNGTTPPKDGCTAFPGESSNGTFFTDNTSRCVDQSGTKQENIILFPHFLAILFRGAFGYCIGIVVCCYSFPPMHTLNVWYSAMETAEDDTHAPRERTGS